MCLSQLCLRWCLNTGGRYYSPILTHFSSRDCLKFISFMLLDMVERKTKKQDEPS